MLLMPNATALTRLGPPPTYVEITRKCVSRVRRLRIPEESGKMNVRASFLRVLGMQNGHLRAIFLVNVNAKLA